MNIFSYINSQYEINSGHLLSNVTQFVEVTHKSCVYIIYMDASDIKWVSFRQNFGTNTNTFYQIEKHGIQIIQMEDL